ncbi:hypothetical protein [Ignatzschineria cameli]|uniref:hypothetical protein n=1 Tax=Ignatzschineria cameli TaxID=2182793 RepID=UPI00130063A2|nr:hypothetical protein [Ignatzschineria cameli]
MPDLTIAYFQKPRAGRWQFLNRQKSHLNDILPALKVPTGGHAPVKEQNSEFPPFNRPS